MILLCAINLCQIPDEVEKILDDDSCTSLHSEVETSHCVVTCAQ